MEKEMKRSIILDHYQSPRNKGLTNDSGYIKINMNNESCIDEVNLEVRIENAKKSIRKLLDISYNGVDEKIIEEFVERVIVHKDYFEWKLNFMNETIKLEVDGKTKKDGFLIEHE